MHPDAVTARTTLSLPAMLGTLNLTLELESRGSVSHVNHLHAALMRSLTQTLGATAEQYGEILSRGVTPELCDLVGEPELAQQLRDDPRGVGGHVRTAGFKDAAQAVLSSVAVPPIQQSDLERP